MTSGETGRPSARSDGWRQVSDEDTIALVEGRRLAEEIQGAAEIRVGNPAPPPKKRRKSSKSPTSRTLDECKRRGWEAGIVERFVRFPPPGHRVDLYGCIDLVVMRPAIDGLLGIQACAGSGHAAHRAKILAEPRAARWCATGNQIELWSWSQRGGVGQRKLWTLRTETYAEMVAGAPGG